MIRACIGATYYLHAVFATHVTLVHGVYVMLTLKFDGGTTLHMPNFSAIGLILSMYSRGSVKSFSDGWNVGASTTQTSSLMLFMLDSIVLLLADDDSDTFCLCLTCALKDVTIVSGGAKRNAKRRTRLIPAARLSAAHSREECRI